MNILVCVSRTPETTAKIAFSTDGTSFVTEGVNYIMNPYDEWYALVRALELKEQHGGTVTLVHVGTAAADTVIRKGLAIGADKAIRVDTEGKSATYTAHQIAAVAQTGGYDLIFTGKETIDYSGAAVGAMIAALLDQPYISFASGLDYDGTAFHVTRDIEGGTEKVKVSGPFVVSAAKGMAEQRIPNMRGIMMAKRKPLEVVPAVDAPEGATISSYRLPEAKTGVKLVDPENMDELVRLLHEEAKVI